MDNSLNEHITEYLRYYVSMPISPRFAVMLRGNWGAGKSWFIRDFIEPKREEYLYMSLYGVTSFKDIEDSFMVQLHPLLASKGVKMAGRVLTGLLKGVLKLDLNGDGKEDMELEGKIPSIDLTGFLDGLKNKKIIFDDLERCSIDINDLLGYINQLVENDGLKVVLIANEEEIGKRKEILNSVRYQDIKEKLIGKSFDIISDFDKAFFSFTNEIQDSQAKNLLLKQKEFIKWLFKKSTYNNLRHLRHAILDFERFYKLLPSKILIEVPKLFQHILELFFSISFEIQKGELKDNDIPKLFLVDTLSKMANEPNKSWHSIREKYSVYNIYNQPIDYSDLTNFFKFGRADEESLKRSIEYSMYFKDKNTPDWVKLYYFTQLDDATFAKKSDAVFNDLKIGNIPNLNILMHVVGMLIYLVEFKLVKGSISIILNLGKSNVKRITSRNSQNLLFSVGHSLGLGYFGKELKEVQEFEKFILTKLADKSKADFPSLAKELLEIMVTNIDSFVQLITVTNHSQSRYYNIPIFTFLKADQFASSLLELSNKDKIEVADAFERRYLEAQFKVILSPELPWLTELSKSLIKKAKRIKSGPTKYILKQYTNHYIPEFIKALT